MQLNYWIVSARLNLARPKLERVGNMTEDVPHPSRFSRAESGLSLGALESRERRVEFQTAFTVSGMPSHF